MNLRHRNQLVAATVALAVASAYLLVATPGII